MDQSAYQELAKMINGFPQSAKNVTGLLLTYEEDLAGISDQAICETAQRYRRNEITRENNTFAPSIAEFIESSRRQEELIALRHRPRLPAPEFRGGGTPPFMVTRQRLLNQNGHLPVLFENISYDQFRKLSAEKAIPVGAKWVAALGIIYGPPAKPKSVAAE